MPGKHVKMLDKNSQQLIGTSCQRNWDKTLAGVTWQECMLYLFFFLHHSAWMFYICHPTWSNLVVIKVVNFKLVSVLLMDFFCLDMSLGKRKELSSYRNPMSYTCILYLPVLLFEVWFLSRSQMHDKTKIIYPYTAILLILQYQARERQRSEMWWWFTSHGFSSWDKKWCLHCLLILCSIRGEFELIIS